MDYPIMLDVWTVDPALREELLERMLKGVREIIVGAPGFISAQVYESHDGGAVILSVTTRTVKDRQTLMDSREVSRVLRELSKIAHSHRRLYRLVESFGEGPAPV